MHIRIILIIATLLATPLQAADFLLGGQIPFWLEHGEQGTPSATPEAERARGLIAPRANEMFDVVIPSEFPWNWVEPRRGQLDMHRYDWANSWARRYNKTTLNQHLLWAWEDSNPRWVSALSDADFRRAVFKHIDDLHAHIGDVPRITVINEMLCKSYITDRLGPEIIREVFEYTQAKFPKTTLYLNEHACPNMYPADANVIGATLDGYADMVNRLQAGSVPFDKVGLQSYFHMADVEAIGGIDAFVNKFSDAVDAFTRKTGHKITITELGFASPDEDYKAAFLRKFYPMLLKNPNIEGLIVYHWLDDQEKGSALVNLDGTLTKGGQVFYEVFGR